jgi:hypothetical protein
MRAVKLAISALSLRSKPARRNFIVLQEVRHKADYDPTARFTRTEALDWVSRAESAIAKLRSASRRDRKAFAVRLLLKKRA